MQDLPADHVGCLSDKLIDAAGRPSHIHAAGRLPHIHAAGRLPHIHAAGRLPHIHAAGRSPHKEITLVHTFRFKNDLLAYDTETQALMMLDELSWSCIDLYAKLDGHRPDDSTLRQLAESLVQPFDEVKICADEIDQLIAEKALFAPAIQVSLDQLYPDDPMIKSMCLHICHDCNLRCRYCFAGTGDFGTGHRSMLDVETGKKAIDFLIKVSGKRRHLDIDFFGGEPLMNWPVVEELVAYCEEVGPKAGKDLRLTITTNGMLLDEKKTEYINKHFKNCVLSLDGRPEVHDDMRPTQGLKGSYKVVMPNIQRFVKARGNKEHYVRGTFTRLHPDFAADVIHMAHHGLQQLSMEPVVGPDGCGYEIREEDLPQIMEEYEKLAEHCLKAREGDHPYNFFHFNIDLEGGPCLFKRLKGCGVGTEYCAVTPEGDIYPCHQFVGEEEFKMGNVNDEPIVLRNPFAEEMKQLILPNKEACQDCWAKYYCSGGCAANVWHANGSLSGVYEIGCKMMRKRLECALWMEAKRMQELEAHEEGDELEEGRGMNEIGASDIA